MPAGVAYDGSVWVTAGSSVALGTFLYILKCRLSIFYYLTYTLHVVIGTIGLVTIGGNLAAKRARDGSLSLPTMGTTTAGARRETESLRSQPLQKKVTDVPKGPEDVDRITE